MREEVAPKTLQQLGAREGESNGKNKLDAQKKKETLKRKRRKKMEGKRLPCCCLKEKA